MIERTSNSSQRFLLLASLAMLASVDIIYMIYKKYIFLIELKYKISSQRFLLLASLAVLASVDFVSADGDAFWGAVIIAYLSLPWSNG